MGNRRCPQKQDDSFKENKKGNSGTKGYCCDMTRSLL